MRSWASSPKASVVALLVLLLTASACGSPHEVVHGLDEYEANQVLVVLASQGIAGQKLKEDGRVVTWAVEVPSSDGPRALEILVNNKLPKQRSQGLAQVYPAGSSGLIPTQSEEKAKFLMAMQGEVERKLKTLPGIMQAHVSIVVPDKNVIRDLDTPPPPATASVAAVYNAAKGAKPPVSADQIKGLVAASVEDLAPEKVEVLLAPNEVTRLLDSTDDGGGITVTGETVLGIKVANKKAGTKAKGVLGLFGGLAIFGLILGVAGIVRSVSLKGRLSKAEAEAASLRKARRELQ